MHPKMLLFAFLAVTYAAVESTNNKRSISGLGYPSWNSVYDHLMSSPSYPWQPNSLPQGSFHSLAPVYSKKAAHIAAVTTAEIHAAITAAKEATAAAALAQQRVQAAREQVAIQEKVAAAKEAAAHAAIQRSEAAARVAAAIQRSEALAAAAAAVQKSAAASAASAAAAHAAGHFSPGPWTPSKPDFNHWM